MGHPVGPMPLCPFWLLKPLPAWQQGTEPRADARHQERDFILQSRQESVCLEDRHAPALPLSVWKAGWESGLKTQPGVEWDCSKTHSVSTPALLGQEKAPEPCVGLTGSPKAAGSSRELSRAGWQKDVVVALVARPRCALCWGTHLDTTSSASLGHAGKSCLQHQNLGVWRTEHSCSELTGAVTS